MRRQFTYALLLCTTFGAVCCSESPTDAEASGTHGAIALKIATRAETDGEYDPMKQLVVRIYNDGTDKLLRKYTSEEALPERYELLAGNYRIRIEAGEQAAASFTKRYYEGEQPFEVTPGVTTPVEVLCNRTSIAAKVTFEESVTENFGTDFRSWIAAGETADETRGDEEGVLAFTSDATGYFTLPEGVTSLAWKFRGQHPSRGEIVKEGRLTGLKAGDNCSLSFRFSPDLPGFIECFQIDVDDTTDDEDDTIVWNGITVSGDGFDISKPLDYTPGKTGSVSYKITNSAAISEASVEIGDTHYDLLNGTTEGIAVERADDRNLTVTFSDVFFTGRPAGENALTFNVKDSKNELTKRSVFRLPGLLPISESDCDLWLNTLTLRALVFDPEIQEVRFSIQPTGGEEQVLQGVAGEDGYYTATFAPTWTEGQNPAGLTVYTFGRETGIFPGLDYTCKAVLGGDEMTTTLSTVVSQPIPYGDMEDGSLSAYGTANTEAPAWGSGNNTFTKSLCTQSTYAGMGGEHCTKLAAAKAPIVGILAAGNFFTGTFTRDGMGGFVDFGQDYDWKARPAGLKFKYHAKVGTVDKTKHAGAGVNSGDQDISVIYVAVVDWSARHRVNSSTSGCSGMWSPDDRTSTDEGAIIGYGILYLEGDTEGDAMIETTIPMQYYDTTARPEGPYKLVISCSTSLYGDYMAGCTTNELYLDDFEWVY